MSQQQMMKERVGRALAERVRDGEIIGVGTGSTVDAALVAIGRRVREEKLRVSIVPTSRESAWRCQEIGLLVLNPGYLGELAWGFDGADAVDADLRAIKGKGAALLQEKILAVRCREFLVLIDESKLVKDLAQACPIPIEIIPESRFHVERELVKLGARDVALRIATGKFGSIVTEGGNIILDARFAVVGDDLEGKIKRIVGVVESGLFTDYIAEVLVASDKDLKTLRLEKSGKRRAD